jgi:uncharacterized protein YdhG (YjbR/CyaY superfamily)
MTAEKDTQKPAKAAASRSKKSAGFSEDELAAMKERAAELKAEARRKRGKAGEEEGEADVLAKIAAMQEPDRGMATRLHALIKESALALTARTWYGMPAYAKEGKVLCYFQSGLKFKTRYSTLGFSDTAQLDDGTLWPVAFALKELTPSAEKEIARLVKQAVS